MAAGPARTSDSAPEVSLTVARAAEAVGVTVQAIRKRLRRGTLESRRVVKRGRLVTVIPLRELRRAYASSATSVAPRRRQPWQQPLEPVAVSGLARLEERQERILRELARLREELAELRARGIEAGAAD